MSIYIPGVAYFTYDYHLVAYLKREIPGMRWSDLGRFLVQFWESRSIRSKVVCPRTGEGSRGGADWVKFFVPESVKRGVFDSVDDFDMPGIRRRVVYA